MAESFSSQVLLGWISGTGACPVVISKKTAHSIDATVGSDLRHVITLAAAETNTAFAIAEDASIVLVEDITETALGVTVKIGSTGATALPVRRLLLEATDGETAAIASGTNLYFTNSNTGQAQVAISVVYADT